MVSAFLCFVYNYLWLSRGSLFTQTPTRNSYHWLHYCHTKDRSSTNNTADTSQIDTIFLSVHFDGIIDAITNKARPPATNRQN